MKNTTNVFDKYMKVIFHKMYLANVSNRLRELENPRDIDCKRWIWELVQNAKDSIAGNKERTKVDIKIIVEGDSFKFSHNGSPFTMETLTALLYKFSEGKRNDSESTGRFGTGFLTTHSLSKTVNVTMYREGEDKELLHGLEKTENSFEKFPDAFGWTTYEYIIKTENNREAGKLGIQNFKDNIALVMLFCPEINSIQLNKDGKIFSIDHFNDNNETKNESEKFNKIIFKVNDNGEISKRTFLYYHVNEYNEQLTQKFGIERNLRICCALELDDNNNIVFKDNIPYLFCSLPLVGSEEHKFPFFINSPDFEPDSERRYLLLDGKEINEKNGKISEPGINKMILLRITKIYKEFLDYVCKMDIRKRYLLIRGINSIPHINFFDSIWYEKNFIPSMREILIEYPIVWNGKEHKKLTDLFIPVINKYDEENKKIKVYNYISELNNKNVPTYEESQIFEKIIWKDDSKIKFKDLEDCVKIIDECKNINKLSEIITNNIWEWIDDFLQFTKNAHYEYLMNPKYAIIPNMNSEFVKLEPNVALSKDVPENMIECLEKFNIKWREEHLHKNLVKFTTGLEHNIKFAVSNLLEKFDKWSTDALILMHYIPHDNNSEFQQKREMIYEVCSMMFKDKMSQKKDGTNFPEEIWSKIDEMLYKKIIEKMQEYGHICAECSIEFINKFLKIVTKYYPSFINYSIIPNKNGKFCKKDQLYKEDNIPDIFKECLKVCFNEDINDELIDDRINNINSLGKKNIFDYTNILKKYFQMNENYKTKKKHDYLSLSDKIKAAEYLIRIIPQKSDDPFIDEQRKLFFIYKFFTQNNDKYFEINTNEHNYSSIWFYSNKYIYDIIREIIEKHSNIDSLCSSIKENKESTIEKLKEFIIFTSTGKIVPNQNNKLCELSNLLNEKDWDKDSEKLKEIAFNLDYDVREELVHKNMGEPCKNDMKYKDICNKIDELMDKKFNETSNHQNEKFKKAAKYLLNYFDDIGEKEAGQFFHWTFSLKEKIAYNVIYDENTRRNFSELDKVFGINNLSQLSNNIKIQNVVKQLIGDEQICESFIEFEKRFDTETISSILKDPKIESFIKNFVKNEKTRNNIMVLEEKFGGDTISKLLENSEKGKFVSNLINNEELFSYFSKYNIDSLKTVFNNPNILNSILKGELTDKNYKPGNQNSSEDPSYSTSSKVTSENKSINISFNSEITKDKTLYDFFQNSLSPFLQYGGDFDFGYENPINKKTGISGEAYIYELLSNSGKYKNIKWNMLDNTGKGEKFEYNGKNYQIYCDGSHYDILVETFDGRKIYVEVKSTRYEFNNKVPFYLSQKQIEKMKQISAADEYVLAIVFDAMNQPKHFFMTLRKSI